MLYIVFRVVGFICLFVLLLLIIIWLFCLNVLDVCDWLFVMLFGVLI